MGLFNHARALRAAMVACLVACFGPVTAVHAAAPEFTGALGAASESAEPFHLWTSRVFWGGLVAKWQGVARKIDDERVQLALCEADRDRCASRLRANFSRSLTLPKHAPAVPGWAKSIGRSIWQGTSPSMAKSTSGVHRWSRFTEEPEVARTTRSRSTSP